MSKLKILLDFKHEKCLDCRFEKVCFKTFDDLAKCFNKLRSSNA
jgi:hypothetical protein